ncbi:ATP-binding protein [Endothiovibrio diazotrophicus]
MFSFFAVGVFRRLFAARLVGPRGLFLLLPLLSPWPAGAAEELPFGRLGLSEGLSQSTVLGIAQDARGFLWFATRDGLNRYDGYRFTVHRHQERAPDSISANFVWALHRDRHGRLWAGTQGGGLNRYDAASGGFHTYRHDPADPASLASGVVVSLAEDRTGRLWVGTDGGGLDRLDSPGAPFVHYRHDPADPSSLGGSQVWAIHEDRAGRLWVGTADGGLDLLDPEGPAGFVHYRHDPAAPDSLAGDAVWSVAQDNAGRLWVGTFGGGLDRLEEGAGGVRFVHHRHDPADPHSLADDFVWTVKEDRRGWLWVGTNNGLSRYDARLGRFDNFLTGRQIKSLFEDAAGNLWVGTFFEGLYRLDRYGEKFERYRHDPASDDTLGNDVVYGIHEDREGRLWVATNGGGLDRMDLEQGKVDHYRHDPADPRSLSSDALLSLAVGRDGTVWAGAYTGGLNRLDPATGRVTRYLHRPGRDDGLGDNTVFSILEDRDGKIWIGTWKGGLDRLDPASGHVDHFRHDPANPVSLAGDFVQSLYQDRDGLLWVGTAGEGVDRFDPATGGFVHYPPDAADPTALHGGHVYAIAQDASGDLWVGTGSGGLNRLDPLSGRVSHITEAHGLPSATVLGIVDDGGGHLWLSTKNGLARLEIASGRVHAFDAADGVQSREFIGGAAHRGRDGTLYFGGVAGLNRFRPEAIEENPFRPPVVLTSFKIFNREAALGRDVATVDALTLGPGDQVISFEFAALNFTHPEKNRYRYRMEGIDPQWIDAGSRRFVMYNNLSPGRYRFRVEASNNDGVWNEEGLSVAIRVLPPWWAAWWAWLLYGAAALALVVGYVRWKTRAQAVEMNRQRRELERERSVAERLRRVDRLKDEFLANTSHELRTPLNGIIGIAESLLAGAGGPLSAAQRGDLAMIRTSGRRLEALVGDLLDFAKLKNDGLTLRIRPVEPHAAVELVAGLTRPLLAGKGVALENRVEEGLPLIAADENRLLQILHNLVGNAVKFTERGHVRLTAWRCQGGVAIAVSDTGIGIPRERLGAIFHTFEQADGSIERRFGGSGLGLAITRRLVELHGGTIEVESTPGEGSTFTVTLPLAGAAGVPALAPEATAPPNGGNEPPPLPEEVAAAPPSAETLAAARDLRGARVLVVDDDPVNLRVVHNHLQLAGMEVTGAASGQACLDRLADERPDLLLLDVMMPRMSGYETARRVRQHHVADDLPILFLSARDQVDDLMEGFAAGGNDYLAKPIARGELLTRLAFQLRSARTRRRLREAEEKYRALFDAAAEGIFQLAPDGQVVSANRALAEILGYSSPVRLIGELGPLPERLFEPERREELMRRLRRGVRVGGEAGELRRPDGTTRWVLFSARAVRDEEGEIRHYDGVLADVTDLKAREAAERERAAAELSSRSKSEFLAAMSHEIRTPMNGVMGFTELLLKSGLNDQQRDYVETISRSSANLLAIINDILDFSKLEAGQMAIDEVPFDLQEVVDEVMALLAPAAVEKGLELGAVVDPAVPERLLGDPLRIRQVLINLVGNAVKFTERGGVWLRAAPAEYEGRSVRLRLAVEDSGVGIPEAVRGRLFRPFSQADASVTRQYGGTGLGLAICRGLVEGMGGTIEVESEPGRGATFRFTVGCRRDPIPPRPDPLLAHRRVVVWEERAVLREGTVAALRRWGVAAEGCADAAQWADAAAGTELLLRGLPEGEEEAVAGALLERLGGSPPVGLLAATFDRAVLERMAADGARFALPKPTRFAELRRELRALWGAPAELAAAEPAEDGSMRGLRILVVDDNDVNRLLAGTLLRRRGVAVVEAESGEAAVRAVVEQPRFDAVLMDIQMPGMSGLEATEEIRKRQTAGSPTPVIALTAHAMPHEREQFLAAGMEDFLSKPLREAELWAVLAQWVAMPEGAPAPAAAPPAGRRSDKPGGLPPYDRKRALEITGGNSQLAERLLGMFRDGLPEGRERVLTARVAGDREGLARAVHKLRGAAANSGAPAIEEVCAELEVVLKGEGGSDREDELVTALLKEIERFPAP